MQQSNIVTSFYTAFSVSFWRGGGGVDKFVLPLFGGGGGGGQVRTSHLWEGWGVGQSLPMSHRSTPVHWHSWLEFTHYTPWHTAVIRWCSTTHLTVLI